ncbi:uncharacterized protein LOC124688616 [Lolium rigidum]|uniref:uncharacterized protein LOC124688616 n=1 Tax=Lolium rigidum TaxID=89674 RepID=UPI001F5C6707|nr:uncharacterized protein LOC124688616 [Lolium rigidum]XP_051192160.1 uncharacterized protein LOC127305685 [Lolium perenne]
MASSSSSCGPGSGRTPGPPKSLAEQFIDHRLLCRSNMPDPEKLPGPLDMATYSPQQTNLCIQLACDFYNDHPDNKGKGLHRLKPERVEGGRSNMFIVDNVDPVSYFHLSFKRKIKKKHYYFAELEGKGGPQRVTMCREINKQTASATICDHCFGGVLHPPEGFLGKRQAPMIGRTID